MSNIKNWIGYNPRMQIYMGDYYDFSLNVEGYYKDEEIDLVDGLLIDFNFTRISRLPEVIINPIVWGSAISGVYDITTIGLTGLDNGYIRYDPATDNDDHTIMSGLLSNSSLYLTENDTLFKMKSVSGATGDYSYDIAIDSGSDGNSLDLKGGFYQGFFKLDGYDYQTLPTRFDKGYTINFELKPEVDSVISETVLNDDYTDNDGFIFYMGLRAENKFWNIFSGNTASGDTCDGTTTFCTPAKETDVTISNVLVEGEHSGLAVDLSPPIQDVERIDNQFLIYGRSDGTLCDNSSSGTTTMNYTSGDFDSTDFDFGDFHNVEIISGGLGQQTVDDWQQGDPLYVKTQRVKTVDTRNKFLSYGRSDGTLCDGSASSEGVANDFLSGDFLDGDFIISNDTYQQLTTDTDQNVNEPVDEININDDIYNNNIGFRLTENGAIGYRILTLNDTCDGIKMVEEYSEDGIVPNNEWSFITIKWVNDNTYDDCELKSFPPRFGYFYFYVNNMLIFKSQKLLEIIPRELDDISEKQVGVPFNISIGGGTQGLLESMTYDGQDPDDQGLPIETNFAGTFIGKIRTFKMYEKSLSWPEIIALNQ